MMRKTTPKHFATFKRQCAKWAHVLGLTSWRLTCYHESLREGDETGDTLAEAWMNAKNRCAGITLHKTWPDYMPPTATRLNRVAFHEVAHLLVEPLADLIRQRNVKEREIVQATEAIIRRLEHLVLPKG